MARATCLLYVLLLGGAAAAQAPEAPTAERTQGSQAPGSQTQSAVPPQGHAPVMQEQALQRQQTIALDVLADGSNLPLTANDFSVTERGESLTIASVRLVVPGEATTPLPAIVSEDDEVRVAAEADRLVAIYIDEYHLTSGASFEAARSVLASFVRASLGPRDLVVVVKPLASLPSIRLSSDRESAARAIEESLARRGDLRPRSSFEQQYFPADPGRIEAARRQIALSSLSTLATHLGRFVNGRKTLIVLSDGLSPLARSRIEAVLPGEESITRSANRARVAVYLVRPSQPADRGEPSPGAAATSAASGRRPTTGSRESAGRDEPLAFIAERTTGLVMDAASAPGGLRQMLGDASRYYLLEIIPPLSADDQYRTVAITSRLPGVRLRARTGYALPRNRRPDPAADTPARAMARIPRHASRLIRVWFGQSASIDGRTHVVFVWEPAPPMPGARTATPGVSRVSVTVTSSNGETIFAGETIASGHAVIAGSAAADQMQAAFDASPGTLLAQIEVLDTAGRVLDRDVRDIVVRGLTTPGTLGTAAVYRARTASDLRRLGEDLTAAPAASRQFSRAESLVIRTVTAGDAEASSVSAQLLSGFGASLRVLDVLMVGGSSHSIRQVELPLAGLASGQYAVEFTANTRSGKTMERVSFSVTP